ncbi:hypothetical protein MNBD_ALPHA07-1728 [hydrothermal vent metagenome]|uniref:LTD domain-containing protein n=1 Tax=hydrothermal vent metagenome TaxID=652676 RepID=A0A3B0S082_9ZZZZ
MADSDIVITEILYDAVNSVNDNNHEWVESFNSGPDPVVLDGWTLDDSRTNNTGVGTFPNVTLQPSEVAIFYLMPELVMSCRVGETHPRQRRVSFTYPTD